MHFIYEIRREQLYFLLHKISFKQIIAYNVVRFSIYRKIVNIFHTIDYCGVVVFIAIEIFVINLY